MLNYLLLFLADGILGYFLQAAGFVIGLEALTRKKNKPVTILITMAAFAVIAFAVRQIPNISFGFHTLLIMAIYMISYVLVFKAPIFQTVIGDLISCIVVSICEFLNMTAWKAYFGEEKYTYYTTDITGIEKTLHFKLIGAPASVLFVIIMLIIYFSMKKFDKKKALKKENAENEKSVEKAG